MIRVFAFLLILLPASLAASAEDIPQASPTEGICSVPADDHWKPQEQFVWKRVCLGDEANFNIEPGYGGDLDPKGPAGLPESRVLSSKFLATILLSDKYRQALTRRGVRIVGARFKEQVDLQNAELSHELWLQRSLLEKGADLQGLRSSRGITFYGSKILGPFKLSGLDLHGDLELSGAAEFGAVYLSFVHVGGTLDLSQSIFAQDLDMAGIQIDAGLLIKGATFASINLTAAHANWLNLEDARITGLLNMNSLRVENYLVMAQDEFAQVLLGLAHVQGYMVLATSKVTGELTMMGLRVNDDLICFKAELNKTSMVGAEVGGNLSLTGATVNGDLSMSGLRVGRDLLLNSISEESVVNSVPGAVKSSLETLGLTGAPDPTAFLKARFANVDLTGANVKGDLSLIGATLSGDLSMDGIQIGAIPYFTF